MLRTIFRPSCESTHVQDTPRAFAWHGVGEDKPNVERRQRTWHGRSMEQRAWAEKQSDTDACCAFVFLHVFLHLQQTFPSPQSFALCVRGTYKYEHSNACRLKPETVVQRCAIHVGEEKWLVYMQRLDGQTAAMINFRNTFPNFESMRLHSEYM